MRTSSSSTSKSGSIRGVFDTELLFSVMRIGRLKSTISGESHTVRSFAPPEIISPLVGSTLPVILTGCTPRPGGQSVGSTIPFDGSLPASSHQK